MTIDQILVTIGGLSLSGWIGWFFWFSEKRSTRVETTESGIQEVVIKVKGGYSPDVITVTELNAIAAPAMIGESRIPKNGYRAPIATGSPSVL